MLLLASGGILLILGWVLVPWQWASGLALDRPPRPEDVFDAVELRRAESHAQALRWLSWSSYVLSALLAVALGVTRAGSRLARWLGRWLPWWLTVPAVVLLLLVAGRLLTLPLGLLARDRNLRDGISTQPLDGWVVDQTLSILLSWALLSAVVLLLVGLARWSPRWWFAWCAAALVGFTFFVSLLYPVVVEPLSNDFEPLPDGAFKESVLQLARDEGVEVSEVLVSDASRRTTTLNAYVSGLGATRRIVLYDNLLDDATPREALAVVAHELAHARHQDVVVGTTLGAVGTVFGVALLALLLHSSGVRRRAGVSGPGDPAATALMVALITAGGVVSSPVQNAVSRAIEARADVTALSATEDPEAFRAVQRRLAARSLADPTPPWIGYLWFSSHPTVLERLAIADAVEQKQARE